MSETIIYEQSFGVRNTITVTQNFAPRGHMDGEFAIGISTPVSLASIRRIGEYVLRWPLQVVVDSDGNYYIAREHEFSIWCDGENEMDAVEGVRQLFLENLEEYLSLEDEDLDLSERREKQRYFKFAKII